MRVILKICPFIGLCRSLTLRPVSLPHAHIYVYMRIIRKICPFITLYHLSRRSWVLSGWIGSIAHPPFTDGHAPDVPLPAGRVSSLITARFPAPPHRLRLILKQYVRQSEAELVTVQQYARVQPQSSSHAAPHSLLISLCPRLPAHSRAALPCPRPCLRLCCWCSSAN